ncbi:MAG: hypothetical protein J2P25_01135 [Nocardiopsaceae bacterium]|nr:hypothetical protein [Nocardiopsaceae bacterium]
MTDDAASWARLLWEEQKFKLLMLQSTASEFENIFTRIMRAERDNEFHIARAGGRKGDAKCDGWDSGSKTLYSVYAPFSVKKRTAIHRKIKGDFIGAREKWPEMRCWRLVHNDFFGLSAEITRALEELRSDPCSDGVRILGDWDPQELWRIVRSLPRAERFDLLGGPDFSALTSSAGWNTETLRFHDSVHPSTIRAAMASLSQLCGNFQSDSALDPICASAMSSAITTFWLEDQQLFSNYLGFLLDRCGSSPDESQITSVAFVMRSIEICAHHLRMTIDELAKLSHWYDIEPGSPTRVIYRIALDEIKGVDNGIFVDYPETRRKYVSGCGRAVVDLLRVTSSITSIPVVFILQDLIISLQRIDHNEGRLVI